MSLTSLLKRWKSDPDIAVNISAWQVLPPRSASFIPFPVDLHPALVHALQNQKIQALYSHQAKSWEYIRNQDNTVIVTGTASGKTLCYNLPVLDCLFNSPPSRALYIFPTKALAQDQLTQLNELIDAASQWTPGKDLVRYRPFPPITPVFPAIYDGDTPQNMRPIIRDRSRLVLTNPDMLHMGILPHHTNWADFLRNIKYVIIDELHSYRGVFGSHVANVLRRLSRVCQFYNAKPLFILTSATIANPKELAERLVDAPVQVVNEDGSARGEKNFLVYNPPIIDDKLGIRKSLLQETVRLAEDLLAASLQLIIFGRARRTVELMLSYLRERSGTPPHPSESPSNEDQLRIRGYRSGYLPSQRREIEEGLRQGIIRAVVATNALELGVDIGQMEAVLLAGYPGTIASTWQQAGRAGRGAEASLAVLVTSSSPIDQFLAHHPEFFFRQTPEQALINPEHAVILLKHLQCAAFELPFRHGDDFGSLSFEKLDEFLQFLISEGVLHFSGRKYYWMADQYPAQQISLRSASPENVILQVEENGRRTVVGEIDLVGAYRLAHRGAIYLHEGNPFLVEDLNLEEMTALLIPTSLDYYTEPQGETTVQIINKQAEASIAGGTKAFGELLITSHITRFRKTSWQTHENLGYGELSLPPIELQTTGYWFTISKTIVEILEAEGLWNDIPNDYGPQWNTLRSSIRARDGFRCRVCGAPEEDRTHDVHHMVPFRSFSSIEQANQPANLVTLCSKCHHQVEMTVRIRSGLSGVAYALGNLAPLFLMCDGRDLGVHSDPVSPLGDGQPVIAIYDEIPAGIGLSERLYEIHTDLIHQAYELVVTCECTDGCPSCVGPGGEQGYGGKREALALLKALNATPTG